MFITAVCIIDLIGFRVRVSIYRFSYYSQTDIPHFLLAAAASFFLIAMMRTEYICAYCREKFLSLSKKRSDSFEYEQVALSILSSYSGSSWEEGFDSRTSAFSWVVFRSNSCALNIINLPLEL